MLTREEPHLLFTAKWADVHLDEARWHTPARKRGPAMDVPLATVAVDWFKELRRYVSRSVYARRQSACSVRRGGG